jgi:hypothetical protein
MQQLLRSLTPEQIQTITAKAEQSIPLVSAPDTEVIRQRLVDWQRLQQEPLSVSPVMQGLNAFISIRQV